jgi:hypothetical protein
MDLAPWELETRKSFERPGMTMPPSGQLNSLPPLQQVAYLLQVPSKILNAYLYFGNKAIPEFHSHNPQERRSSSVPRKLVERVSPSYRPSHQISPSSSGATLDNGMATFSLLGTTAIPTTKISPDFFLTDGITVTVTNDPLESSCDSQAYGYLGQLECRRMSGISSHSSLHSTEPRPSPYLPPVPSMASSRGSSFDMEASDTASHAVHHGQYESDIARSQRNTPDYHRYSVGTKASPGAYRSTSPTSYSQAQYYSQAGAYSQQPGPHGAYAARQPVAGVDPRASYPPAGGPPGEVGMDSYEQGRPGKRRRGNLPKQVTDLLRSWLNDHLHHPYPTEDEKQMLMQQTGLTIHQVCL